MRGSVQIHSVFTLAFLAAWAVATHIRDRREDRSRPPGAAAPPPDVPRTMTKDAARLRWN